MQSLTKYTKLIKKAKLRTKSTKMTINGVSFFLKRDKIKAQKCCHMVQMIESQVHTFLTKINILSHFSFAHENHSKNYVFQCLEFSICLLSFTDRLIACKLSVAICGFKICPSGVFFRLLAVSHAHNWAAFHSKNLDTWIWIKNG